MKDKLHLISDLIVSIAGVMLFLSVNKLIDLNGWNKYSIIIALVGIALLFFADNLAQKIPINFVSKSLIIALAHVLVFLGIKDTLSIYMDGYMVYFLVAGIILLSYSKKIAEMIIKK